MNTEQKIFEVVLELKDKLSGQTANVAKKTNDSLAGLQKTVGSLKTAFISLVGITSVGMFFNTITNAAMQQEAAITKLNSVLKSTGQYSIETSQSLAAYATQLQRFNPPKRISFFVTGRAKLQTWMRQRSPRLR